MVIAWTFLRTERSKLYGGLRNSDRPRKTLCFCSCGRLVHCGALAVKAVVHAVVMEDTDHVF